MVSQVLFINGSPRGAASGSFRIAQAFVSGLGAEHVDTFSVCEMNLQPCRGCLACWHGSSGCVIADDMQPMYDRILASDTIVVSFPLYYFGLPGPLKTVLDRTVALMRPYDGTLGGLHVPRIDMTGKRFAVISTCGYAVASGVYDALDLQLHTIFEKTGYAAIHCPQGELVRSPSLDGLVRRYLGKVTEAGRLFAATGSLPQALENELARPLIPQRAFEKIVQTYFALSPS